jgi:regulator of RNase E activity RraB
MGLLSDLFSNGQGPYVTESDFKRNLRIQQKLAPITLDQLRKLGVEDHKELRIEFFFYSKTVDKAEMLTMRLKQLNYETYFSESAGHKHRYLINGWTTEMKMDDQTVANWTTEMCKLGYKFDCEFDGWGTYPEQD